MLISYQFRTALLGTAVFLALPLLASSRPKPDNNQTETKSMQLYEPATVDGTTLAPGHYQVIIDGNKANFEHDGKPVATAPCDWKATIQVALQQPDFFHQQGPAGVAI